ncbi:MAG: putative acetyltransferase [Arenicella sp.]|jgi:putative acetyltransferase
MNSNQIPDFKNFQFQQATNSHISQIKQLIFGVLREYGLTADETAGPDVDLNDIEVNYPIGSRNFFWIVQNSENELVGTMALAELNEKECELRKMFLSKSVRGKGLGKFMVGQSISVARKLNYSTILLETDCVLKEAMNLYRNFGFESYENPHICTRCDTAMKLELVVE